MTMWWCCHPVQPSVPQISQLASAIANTSTLWQSAEATSEGLVASLYLGNGVVPVPEKIKRYGLWNTLAATATTRGATQVRASRSFFDFSWIQCYSTLVSTIPLLNVSDQNIMDLQDRKPFFNQCSQSVLAHKFPSKVPQLMAYQSIIVRCYTDYEGDSWLAYDQGFRRKAAYEKCLDWSKLMPRRQCKEECGVRKLFKTRPPDKTPRGQGIAHPIQQTRGCKGRIKV